jgi:hypothetical protein
MGDRKLYLQAVRALPEEWINDDTRIAMFTEGRVFAANPAYPPMEYIMEEWWPIEFKEKGETI